MIGIRPFRVAALVLLVAGLLPGVIPTAVAAAGRHHASSLGDGRPAVVGTLVAKPVSGESTLPPRCRDRDQTTINTAVQQQRGLVICTEEGRLVLLELSPATALRARYGAPITVGFMRDGDRIRAWGQLMDNGYALNPTAAIQDVDLQEAFTNSQDFIASAGDRLTLYVLSADAQGPVSGIVHAVRGGRSQVYLCNGALGSWADLKPGETINITESFFNRRIKTYVDTDIVHIATCA
ncbi:MAG TPA: hypothetical protein VFB58_07715 [Chloroflexota bacterium]|nr:hypothetical protein [Chloroflexota bacterium]